MIKKYIKCFDIFSVFPYFYFFIPPKEGSGCLMPLPVWNHRTVIWSLFPLSSLIFLPTPLVSSTHTHTHPRTHAHTHTHTHIHACMHAHTRTHAHTHTHTQRMHTRTHIHTRMHVCTHAHTHTHTHTRFVLIIQEKSWIHQVSPSCWKMCEFKKSIDWYQTLKEGWPCRWMITSCWYHYREVRNYFSLYV